MTSATLEMDFDVDCECASRMSWRRSHPRITPSFRAVDTHEGQVIDPLSLHEYLYAGADPINAIDPSGNDALDDIGFLGALGINSPSLDIVSAASSRPSSGPSNIYYPGVGPYLQLIENHEGRRYTVYNDSKGNPTIGVGFNLNRSGAAKTISQLLPGVTADDLLNGKALTDDQIDILFQHDVSNALEIANNQLSNFGNLASKAQEVVVDMVFNLGPSRFAQFKNLKSALAQQDYNQAAQEMINSKWYNQTGNRAEEDVQLMQDAANGK